jgi:hypothetical protein
MSMERYIFCVVPAGLTVTGVCMVLWPGAVVAQSRDRDDPTPIPAHQVWLMRGLGPALVAGGAYGLYALLAGLPGAEFNGV